jgi:hypothetical protein
MCEECQQLLEEYRVLNEELKKVVRALADASRSSEIEIYNKLWERGLEFSQKSTQLRLLLLDHLQTHGREGRGHGCLGG